MSARLELSVDFQADLEQRTTAPKPAWFESLKGAVASIPLVIHNFLIPIGACSGFLGMLSPGCSDCLLIKAHGAVYSQVLTHCGVAILSYSQLLHSLKQKEYKDYLDYTVSSRPGCAT